MTDVEEYTPLELQELEALPFDKRLLLELALGVKTLPWTTVGGRIFFDDGSDDPASSVDALIGRFGNDEMARTRAAYVVSAANAVPAVLAALRTGEANLLEARSAAAELADSVQAVVESGGCDPVAEKQILKAIRAWEDRALRGAGLTVISGPTVAPAGVHTDLSSAP